MKRINGKKLSIAAAVLFGVNMAFGANVIEKYKATAEKSFYQNKYNYGVELHGNRPTAMSEYSTANGLTWSGIKGAYAFNKAALHYYGSALIIENHQVSSIKEDLRVARKNKDKSEIAFLKRKQKKAKLDLFRDQCHFIIDREALRQDYLLVIADRRKELAGDRKDLSKAKADLRKDKKNVLILKKVEMKKKEIKADKWLIANERASLKKEMADADKIYE